MAIRGVIFDGFGTLLTTDSANPPSPEGAERAKEQAWRRAHAAVDGVVRLPPFQDFLAAYAKERESDRAGAHAHAEANLPKRMERVFLALGLGQRQARVLGPRAAERYFAELGNATRLIDDAKGILNRLPDGARVALCTNFPSAPDLRRALERLDLLHRFDALAVSAEVGVLKPDARMFREALDGLGLDPPDCVFVGDSPEHDIRPARALGMRAILVANPRGRMPPERVEADAVLGTLHELPLALAKLS